MKTAKKTAKKLLMLCITGMIILSSITCYASTELILNHGLTEFNRLLIVDNGKTYIPLRMVFSANAGRSKDTGEITYGFNPNYSINIESDHIDEGYVIINMVRKDANGALLNEGRNVTIAWGDDILNAKDENGESKFPNGRISFKKYTINNKLNVINTNPNEYEYGFQIGLDSAVKAVQVNDKGGRLFLSLDDIEKIVNFMTDGNNYQVDIIEE